jgi:hypothetical protein
MGDHVTILVVVGQHSFAGEVDADGLRVLDLLNDPGTDYLQLACVAVHQRFFDGVIRRLSRATIPKSQIDFVLMEEREHESHWRERPALVEERPHQVFVVLDDYEICGDLMLKEPLDKSDAFNRELSTFLTVTDSRLSAVGTQGPIKGGTALINRSKVTLLQIGELA